MMTVRIIGLKPRDRIANDPDHRTVNRQRPPRTETNPDRSEAIDSFITKCHHHTGNGAEGRRHQLRSKILQALL